MTYAEVNGQQLYYETHGTGRPLVALHGGVLTVDLTFGHVLPWLAKDRQVIAVELQGHGHTADTDRPFTLPNLAADVVALLDHIGLDRADLFGYSLGGLVATQVAISAPDRVNRLVLAAAHFNSAGYHAEILDPAQWETSTRMPTAEDFGQMRDAYLAVAPDPDHFEAFLGKTSGVPRLVDDWTEAELRAIAAPTLVIIGDRDFVRISHAEQMLDLLAAGQLAVLPNTTHMGVMHHELLRPLVEPFLG